MPSTSPAADAGYEHHRLLATLNDRQREAVTADDGPILVIAGPGSGKTRVICARIAHLVRTGRAVPARIAAITFTRKAADEMSRRLRTLLPAREAHAVWISTFHRLCGRLLREHGAAIGIPADFRIVDEPERIAVMRGCMFDAKVDTRVHKPQALLHRLSVIKNRMQAPANPEHWNGDEYAVRNARLAATYQTALAEAKRLDFDDLLLGAVHTLHEHPDARRAAGERFPRVLVDEYQDTNLPQYVLVRQLSENRDDVFVVGDPDQAIYGWRGAELQNILSFQRDFPSARRIDLRLAYRSGGRLLAAATAMIRHNADRLDHGLQPANPPGPPLATHDATDATDEAAFAVDRALRRIQRDNGSVAVLYRTNAQSIAFETTPASPTGSPGARASTSAPRCATRWRASRRPPTRKATTRRCAVSSTCRHTRAPERTPPGRSTAFPERASGSAPRWPSGRERSPAGTPRISHCASSSPGCWPPPRHGCRSTSSSTRRCARPVTTRR